MCLYCNVLPYGFFEWMQGAQNVTLEGVFHSISRSGTFADCNKLVWYGSEDVVDTWLHALA